MHTDYGLGNLFDNGHSNSASQALPIHIFFDIGSHILINVTWYNIKSKAFFCVFVTFTFLSVSLNDINCWDFVASVDERTSMDRWWNDIARVKPNIHSKIHHHNSTLSTTNTTWTGLRMNPSARGERSAIKWGGGMRCGRPGLPKNPDYRGETSWCGNKHPTQC
jgi:hypothetical protein